VRGRVWYLTTHTGCRGCESSNWGLTQPSPQIRELRRVACARQCKMLAVTRQELTMWLVIQGQLIRAHCFSGAESSWAGPRKTGEKKGSRRKFPAFG